jgi:hypothetical protein
MSPVFVAAEKFGDLRNVAFILLFQLPDEVPFMRPAPSYATWSSVFFLTED